eukprot:TRINITY_DN4207_c0_g1_i1.p1 TRINITY_DN4207_c0_g1~~TRINITY_DN4207_c0_g1_i1.p1  ORF type:complete len:555 (+),score=70.91 TRINITY_DN4207_c0_g1_i1:65-1729(+)
MPSKRIVKKRPRSDSGTPVPAQPPPATRVSAACDVIQFHTNNNDGPVGEVNKRIMRNTLESILYPLSVKDFKEKYWNGAKALAVVGGGEERIQFIKERFFDNLDVDSLLHRTPSEQINVWMTKTSGENTSFKTSEETAKECYQCGASLYFRAPEEFESSFLALIGEGLGMGHAAFHHDGDLRAEVETFVSHKGHTTSWHFDFMENITIQLKGKKTWKLKKSGVAHPYRACALHFESPDSALLGNQTVLAKLQNPEFTPISSPQESDYECVTLSAGDIMYHPAGIWHEVSTDEDSISVNLSYMHKTWGEILLDAAGHLTRKHPLLLQRYSSKGSGGYEGVLSELQPKLELFVEELKSLVPQDILPRCRVHPTDCIKREKSLLKSVVISEAGSVSSGGFSFDPPLQELSGDVGSISVVKNPLGVLVSISQCSAWQTPKTLVAFSKTAKRTALSAENRSEDHSSDSSDPESSDLDRPGTPVPSTPMVKYTALLTTTEDGDALAKITIHAPATCTVLRKVSQEGPSMNILKFNENGKIDKLDLAALSVLLWMGMVRKV